MAEEQPTMGQEDNKKGRVRKSLVSAKGAVTRTVGKATGAEFREEFEKFTDAVTTSVMGLHGDMLELEARVDKIQTPGSDIAFQPSTRLALAALVISIFALLLSAAALFAAL